MIVQVPICLPGTTPFCCTARPDLRPFPAFVPQWVEPYVPHLMSRRSRRPRRGDGDTGDLARPGPAGICARAVVGNGARHPERSVRAREGRDRRMQALIRHALGTIARLAKREERKR